MMRFGLKIIILGLLVIFATSCVQIRVFGKRMDVVDIPHIETWKEIIYSEDSNNDKNDRGQCLFVGLPIRKVMVTQDRFSITN